MKQSTLSIACALALCLSACGDDSKGGSSDAGDASAQSEDGGAAPGKDAATGTPKGDAAAEADAGGTDPESDAGSTPEDAGDEHDAGHDAGDAGGMDAGPPPELNCASYCSLIMSHCTGANAQYVTQKNCLDSCKFFAEGALSDTSGNTLGCRIYHAGAAGTAPVPHCPHAGISGGDSDPTDGVGGPCGDACGGYCDVAWGVCTDDVFASGPQDCPPACKALKKSASAYSTTNSTGDSYNCHVYEISQAASKEIACRDILSGSARCK